MSRAAATMIGFSAALMWAMLALLTASTGHVPPFQLAAMTFFVGGLLGLLSWPFRPGAARALLSGWRVWALGVGGLFGYHFAYFSALRLAPPVEASLIAYLWPLLLVLFSAMLPGERLGLHHLAGTVIALAGAALVIGGGNAAAMTGNFGTGHALALLCALIWSGYSVISRRFGQVPTDAVSGFCLVASLLSLIAHVLFEETVWPQNATQWLCVLSLGLFPVGAAFYAWDLGVKRGDIMVLGAASYASPLLSTLALVLAGHAAFGWPVAAACLLITAGAVLAAKDMLFPRRIATP